MRTLKRLEIGQLNEFESLSAEEQGMIVGGKYSKNAGDCFWNCMEFCSRKFNKDKEDRHDHVYYAQGFESGNATWPGTGSTDHGLGYGPDYGTRNSDGTYTVNETPYNYLASQFKTEGSGWTKGSDMTKYFGSNYDKKSVIIGTFDVKGKTVQVQGSEDEAHAAIFTGYNPVTKEYEYYEANDRAKEKKTIKEQYVMGVAKVTGNKAKTEGSDN